MRLTCPNCYYPLVTCVCDHVRSVIAPVPVIILQHSNEVNNAKNTARLVALSLHPVEIVSGKTANDFVDIQQRLAAKRGAVFYPGEHSHSFDESPLADSTHQADYLLFLDGSWRQAHGLWEMNPWLGNQTQWHFTHAPTSQYRIRHTDKQHSLSTLEAIAYALRIGYDTNTQPLIDLQQAMQSHWQAPDNHLRR